MNKGRYFKLKNIIIFMFAAMIALGAVGIMHAVNGAYINHLSKKEFKAEMVKRALASGVSASIINAHLKPAGIIVTKQGKVRRKHWRPVSFAYYKKSFIRNTDWPLGIKKYNQYYSILKNIQKKYGVDPGILVAIWASETGYGNVQGSQKLIPTLLTQAYASSRSEFMVTQLIDALKILQQAKPIQPYQLRSTYDGGMGMIQMEPSTYVQYAVTYSGSGQANIWKSVPDALSSAANLLQQDGWQRGLAWGLQIKLTNNMQRRYAENKTRFAVLDLKKLSLSVYKNKISNAKYLRIIMPDKNSSVAFLVTNNFKTLLRWNRNTNQAIVIGLFADHMKASRK